MKFNITKSLLLVSTACVNMHGSLGKSVEPLCLGIDYEVLHYYSISDVQEDEIFSYPEGLVLVPRGSDENSVVVGSHIRGSRLRASAAGFEEVDLLLPGTAR